MKLLLKITFILLFAQAVQAEKIKIGVISDLSGPVVLAGERCMRGFKVAIAELPAPEAYQFIYEDSASRPVMAVNAINKLIKKDQVVATAIFASSNSFAISPITTRDKLPVIALAGAEKVFTDKFPYNFSSWPSAEQEAGRLAEDAYKQGIRKIAIATTENDYTLALRDSFIITFEKLGGEVTLNEEFVHSETDYKSFIAKLRVNQAEAVYVNLLVNTTGQFLKQLHQLGNKKQAYGTYYLGTKSELDLAGDEAASGVRFITTNTNNTLYHQAARKLFPNHPIEVLSFNCSIGMQRLLQTTESLRKANQSVTKAAIYQKLKEQKEVDFFGQKIPTAGKLLEFEYQLQMYQEGKYFFLR